MIALKCRNCDASLERKPGVGLADIREGGSYDDCPDRIVGRAHVAQKLMIVTVSAKIAVDVDAWTLAYGTEDDAIDGDVRDYALERLRGMVTDELMVRDVTVRGA
jgi:hypothetical protein